MSPSCRGGLHMSLYFSPAIRSQIFSRSFLQYQSSFILLHIRARQLLPIKLKLGIKDKSGMSTKQKEKNERSHLGDASEMKGKAFDGLKLASHEVLERAQMTGRSKCPKCNGSRMFYCYTCFSLVGVNQDDVPKIKLPVKIDIIKHPHETDGKSTAVHAKLIAPDDVTVYTYPCIPEYDNEIYKVVLVFPGPGSVTVEEMMEELLRAPDKGRAPSAGEPSPKRVKRDDESEERESTKVQQPACALEKVVFIDSTWNQTNKIISDERLQALLRVELKTRKTCFWRHQRGSPDTYLATIEAIYYFLKDYHVLCLSQDYQGDYDNLLYFFVYLHKLINSAKHSAGKL